MECLSRNRRAVRVCSGGRVGYLYFDGGNIVHSATRHLQGEAAAFEVLSWETGTFEPCVHMSWPAKQAIQSPWQALLMRAAVARDHGPAKNLVSFPLAKAEPTTEQSPDTTPVMRSTEPPIVREVIEEPVVRLGPGGDLEAGDDEELAEVGAYAVQTARKLADALGEDGFLALEWVTDAGHCLVYAGEDGGIVAMRRRDERGLVETKSRFGL
jgi:hypothetical protein